MVTFGPMNSKHCMRTIISLLLVFFLFAPVVLRANHIAGPVNKKLRMEKASDSSPKSELQALFEEKEKEEKSSRPHFIFFGVIQHAALRADPFYRPIRNSGFLHSCHHRTPVFLAVRSIRI
jgi:hypothetical protein